MNIKKFFSLILALLMVSSTALVACTTTPETDETSGGTETSDVESSNDVSSPSESESKEDVETDPSEGTTESTATEEETEKETITDVMIGETLEAEYADSFSVSRVFSNDMVVQRNEHIRVWGFAPESENGKKVSGEFKGMFAEAIIEDGEWCITFGARLEADVNGADMKIYTDEAEVVFSGVLVGDVYMVIGQSNVEASVSSHVSSANSELLNGIKDSIDPDSIIRLNRTTSSSGGSFSKKGTDYVYKDLLNTKQWTKTTEADTLSFSAIGYYFAKLVAERNDNTIPVGVIEIGFSGAPLGSFLPNEVAEEYKTDTLNASTGKYTTTGVNSDRFLGRAVYNCHLAPFEKYAIAGMVWYQGESNNALNEAYNYNTVFSALIDYMRSTHNVVNEDFPVFVMEFPSIYKAPANFSGTWHFMELGIIRSVMGGLPLYIDNCYVSVSGDLWNDKQYFNSLHPLCKYEQAERLADLADAVIYNNAGLDSVTGPVLDSYSFSEDHKTVILKFTNVGEGLTTANGSTAVKGIVGLLERSFGHSVIASTTAEITGKDEITVTFAEPVKSVAYNYYSSDFYGDTINLCNSNARPASGFLTPYKEKDIGTIGADSFQSLTSNAVKLVRYTFDKITSDGVNLFAGGSVLSMLQEAGNKATIEENSTTLTGAGWIGFQHDIVLFGYSVDGGDAIFNTYPTEPEAAVKNAAGQKAKRFTINVNTSKLEAGMHTVSYLALIEIKDKFVAVEMLSFTLEVIERPIAPDGVNFPGVDTGEYGFNKAAHDQITVDGNQIYVASADQKIAAAGNKLTVTRSNKTLLLSGWAGFQTKIEKFGYAIDGDVHLDTNPAAPNDAIIAAGGENSMKYAWRADLSQLEVGLHTIDVLVSIYMGDETVSLVMYSFTLEITE